MRTLTAFAVAAILAVANLASAQGVITAGTQYSPEVFQAATINAACADPCTTVTAGSALTIALQNNTALQVFITASSGTYTFKVEDSTDGVNYQFLNAVNEGVFPNGTGGKAGTRLVLGGTTFSQADVPGVPTGFIPNVTAGAKYFRVRLVTCAACSLTVMANATTNAEAYNVMLPVSSWLLSQIPQRSVLIGASDASTNCNGTSCQVPLTTRSTSPTGAEAGVFMRVVPNTSSYESNFKEAITATTEVFAVVASTRHYVTGAVLTNEAATVQTVDIVYGTGTNCGTGTTALTPKFQMGTNATTTSPFVVSISFPTPLVPAVANAICVRPANATAFGAVLTAFQGN